MSRDQREYGRAYYEANRARILDQQRAHREANKERINNVRRKRKAEARGFRMCDECGQSFPVTRTDRRFCSLTCGTKRWERDNSDKRREVARAWREANKVRLNASRRTRVHRDRVNPRKRAHREANKERINAQQRAWLAANNTRVNAERRAKAAAARGTHTCVWCRRVFVPSRRDQRWCSRSCAARAWEATAPPNYFRDKSREAKRRRLKAEQEVAAA